MKASRGGWGDDEDAEEDEEAADLEAFEDTREDGGGEGDDVVS